MSDHFSPDGSFINSIVGEGTRFKGELRVSGLLRIDGDFSGEIETAGKVLVGKNGRAECTINAETVVIGGVVRGNIVSSDKVVILSTGMLIGNVSTPRLIVEEGVIVHGKCMICTQPKTLKAPELVSVPNETQGNVREHPPVQVPRLGETRLGETRLGELKHEVLTSHNPRAEETDPPAPQAIAQRPVSSPQGEVPRPLAVSSPAQPPLHAEHSIPKPESAAGPLSSGREQLPGSGVQPQPLTKEAEEPRVIPVSTTVREAREESRKDAP
jgi:cytoskeletal protein CcmA (bactofilin family)